MKLELDIHIHTLASGHAYSTLMEYVTEAKKRGLTLIAQTDHGPDMPGGPHPFHIGNQIVIPRKIEGIDILRGVEANIRNVEGGLDIPEKYLSRLDIVLASLHDQCIEPMTREENTKALIAAMASGWVDIIAHGGNPKFPIDIEAVVKAAGEYRVLMEINNSSFRSPSRSGSRENCIEIARMAKKLDIPIVAGTDSHIASQVGVFDQVQEVLELVEMPEHLIMNTNKEKLKAFLRGKGRKIDP